MAKEQPLSQRSARKRTFYYARLVVLMAVFLGVSGWAWNDMRERRERNSWLRPLDVGFVVLRAGPVSDEAVLSLRARVADLEKHLQREFLRWTNDNREPFRFSLYGPLDIDTPPPESYSDKLLDLAYFAYQQWRYLRQIDERAQVPRSLLDSRIYLVVRPANPGELQFVEGQSEQGGRIGIVGVQLDDTMVDFTLFVATHELLHTLGATDKYDDLGHANVPDGLAEPDRMPTYPQEFVEVMARNRPISPAVEEPPGSLEELRVGQKTAREIGWIPPQ